MLSKPKLRTGHKVRYQLYIYGYGYMDNDGSVLLKS